MTHVQSPLTIEPPSAQPDSTSAPQQFPDIPPAFAQSSADEVLDTPSLNAWTNHLDAQQQRQLDVERVTIRVPSVQEAARSMWSAILALANNQVLPDPESGCVITHFTVEAIMSRSPRVHVGGSVGVGVLRAIWATMWKNLLSVGCGNRLWIHTDDDFTMLSLQTLVLATRITEEDTTYLRH